jgi:hypothetical protein
MNNANIDYHSKQMEQNSAPAINQTYTTEPNLFPSSSQTQSPSRHSTAYRNHSANQPGTSYSSQRISQYEEYPYVGVDNLPRSSSGTYSQNPMNLRHMTYQHSQERNKAPQTASIPTPNIPKLVPSPSIQYPTSPMSTHQHHRIQYPYSRPTDDPQVYVPSPTTYSPSNFVSYSPHPQHDIPVHNDRQNPPSPSIIDTEKESMRNVEFKYLRLIQEVLFLVTKYSTKTKSNSQNTELISLTNELLNVVQRHTAEPLEKTSTFQVYCS